MKTKSTLLAAALVAALVNGLPAAETPAACCVVEKPAAPCCPVPETKPAASCCTEEKPAAPFTAQSLYQLETAWTDDAGATARLASLRGRPVVLAMVFASCEYACPVLVNDIQRLRAALPEGAREKAQVVLVTFDSVRDTPEALRAFRARMGLDASWTLLRADADAVQELAMLLGVKYKQDARGQFAHSNLFTILNAEGEIVHQHAGLNGDISEAARFVAKLGE